MPKQPAEPKRKPPHFDLDAIIDEEPPAFNLNGTVYTCHRWSMFDLMARSFFRRSFKRLNELTVKVESEEEVSKDETREHRALIEDILERIADVPQEALQGPEAIEKGYYAAVLFWKEHGEYEQRVWTRILRAAGGDASAEEASDD